MEGILFLLAVLLLIVVPVWYFLVYLFVGPDIRYVQQNITIKGDVNVTNQVTQVPVADQQRLLPGAIGNARNVPLPPPANRVIGVDRPAPSAAVRLPVAERKALPSGKAEIVTADYRIVR